MRKFKNDDEETFQKLMRMYLHTSPLNGIWVSDQNGNEWPLRKVQFMR